MSEPKDNLNFTQFQQPAEGQLVHFWPTADVDRDPDSFGVRGHFRGGVFTAASDSRQWSPTQIFVWRAVDERAEAQAVAAIRAAVEALATAADLIDGAGLGVPVWTRLDEAHRSAQLALAEASGGK